MQKYAKVTIKIKPNGTAKAHIEGMEGSGCEDLEEALFASTGGLVSSEDTEEMYLQKHDNPQHLNIGG